MSPFYWMPHLSVQLHTFIPQNLPVEIDKLWYTCACVLISFQLLYEEVLSHSSPLETISTKGSSMAEHYTTQQEVQQLQSRYNALKEKAKVLTHSIWFYYFLCRHLNNEWLFWNFFSQHLLHIVSKVCYIPTDFVWPVCVMNAKFIKHFTFLHSDQKSKTLITVSVLSVSHITYSQSYNHILKITNYDFSVHLYEYIAVFY